MNNTKEKTLPTFVVRIFLLAEVEGFEPPGGLTRQLISSQPRYDHFDTPPYELFSPFNLP